MLLKHPKLTGITRDVPDQHVQEWIAQGWMPPKPEPDTKTNNTLPEPQAEAKAKKEAS